jgi:two-component system phosphate regulon sensor histidine kinase PhoR
MSSRRLFWQLMPTYLLITLVAVLTVSGLAIRYLKQFYLRQAETDLAERAALVMNQVAPRLAGANPEVIDPICKEHGLTTHTRVTILAPDGRVIGDSHEDPARMDNHAGRPEVAEALRNRAGFAERYSDTLHQKMIYAAFPAREDGRLVGVVRTAIPMTAFEQSLNAIIFRIGLSVLAVILAAGLVSYLVSSQISRPLEEMTAAAERFARGDFNRRVPVPESRELGRLADSMNWMAAQLDDQIGAIQLHRNEEEAVLSSMVEGVLAVDEQERIINLNPAAARLLGVDAAAAQHRDLLEVIRNVDIQRLVSRVLESHQPAEGDVLLHENGTRHLQAHGTPLRDAKGLPMGALVVLHDVTRLKQLEGMRRDFVANVSHEIKTPITSIKGFVETLQDGAIDEPENARRFLGIIAKQVDRLTSIIDDLLSLSRIEKENERGEIMLEPGNVRDVLETALEICAHRAEARRVRVERIPGEPIRMPINAALLEQAVVNLVDNAIKYSPENTRVEVRAAVNGRETVIEVADEGPGIPAEHLDRIFERFYRVDKARSRAMGGTGLGLAIVKHIAHAHGGRVEVESVVGKGSTFRIHLPNPGDEASAG